MKITVYSPATYTPYFPEENEVYTKIYDGRVALKFIIRYTPTNRKDVFKYRLYGKSIITKMIDKRTSALFKKN